MELANLEKLADELIELRSDTFSLRNVYEYLLRAYGDAKRAKADFMLYLSGDLPARVLQSSHPPRRPRRLLATGNSKLEPRRIER